MNKYLQITKFTIKKEAKFILNYLSSIFGFTIHIIVFYFIWDYILGSKQLNGYTTNMLIWYVIVGEYILYSSNKFNRQISSDVKNGTIANMLTKPINFVLYLFFENASNIIKIIVNLIAAILLGLIMAGPISLSITNVIFFIISILFSILLNIMFELIIGLSTFFIEETKALYLVLSKLMLIIVFSPVEMFPQWGQIILKFLPTTYAIYAPAKILVMFDISQAIKLILCQLLSIIICCGILFLQYKKGVKKINVNGG